MNSNFIEHIDIFERKGTQLFSGCREYKVRMILGFRIKNTNKYYYKKYGVIQTLEDSNTPHDDYVEMRTKLYKAAFRTYKEVVKNKPHKMKLDLYAGHFGEPYEVDSDYNYYDKLICTVDVECDRVFFFKDKMTLPEKYKDLTPVRLPERTGKEIEV